MATINLKDYAFFRKEHIYFIDSDEGTLPEVMKRYFNIDVDHSHAN
jgi:hypothetical protein